MSYTTIQTVLILTLASFPLALTLSIPNPRETIQMEERFVAKIVKDIISKVSHFSHHVIESNETAQIHDKIAPTLDITSSNSTNISSEITDPLFSDATPSNESDDAPSLLSFPFNVSGVSSGGEDDYDDDDEDEDADDYEEDESEIPLSSLDPGSEYVLKVFSKLRKGNSMESATKELTAKLSHAHR